MTKGPGTRAATILHKASIGPSKMLSCGRIIGRLPKLTNQAPVNHFHRPLKYTGIIKITNLWYSKKVDQEKPEKPVGTTIKPEECTPNSRYSNSKRVPPICESQPNACCPPSCYQVHGQSGGNQDKSRKGSGFKITKIPYWELWGTLIVTGVLLGIDALTNFITSRGSHSQKDASKRKEDGSGKHRRADKKVRNPSLSSSIPQEVPYVLIGGGTAAFSAFRSIKSRDPKAKVLVITEEQDFPYMRPPLSKELWYNTDRATTAQLYFKQWNGTQRSIFYEPQEFYSHVSNLNESDKGGVAVATGWKVTKLDVVNRTVTLDDGYEIKYDKCLIATGASPKTLPIFGSAEPEVMDKVTTFRTKEDFLDLEDKLHDPTCKNVVIIGGGFLGSELACALARNLGKEKKIIQVFKEKFIMAQVLPEYLSEWTTKKSSLEGVQTISNAEVQGYRYKNKKLSLVLNDGRTIDADQVIVAVGAEPNTGLATVSNLETHPEVGGYLVNAELEARSNVWVAGDAACFYDVKLGRRRVEHHDHAVVSGRLAGENMTGAEKPYTHQSMFWSDLGPEVGYEAVGIIDSSLPTVGVFAEMNLDSTNQSATATDNKTESTNKQEAISKPVQTAVKDEQSQHTEIDNSKNNHTQAVNAAEERVTEKDESHNNFEKGVIFYLKNDIIVGIVLWNIFNRMSIARQVLSRGTKYDDLNEVAKLFTIHED